MNIFVVDSLLKKTEKGGQNFFFENYEFFR